MARRCHANEGLKRCYKHAHVPDCRPARPLCRWQRAKTLKYRVCECEGYEFPHRRGSGCCTHSEESAKKLWERNTGTSWETGEPLEG